MIYVLIILIILLIMPIEMVFTKDEKHNDVDIYLTKLFNIRLDFDEFLKFLLTTKENRDKITLSGIKQKYELFKLSRNLIYSVSKNSRPKNLSLVITAKKIYPEIDIFVYVAAWNLLYFARDKLHEFAPKLNVERYDVEFNDKFKLEFKWSIRLRAVYIIFSIIKNYKDLIKIRKFLKKGKKKYGTSSNF